MDTSLTPWQQQQLDRLDVRIADLPGATLGQALGTTITIDINAAGYGWFVDPTPGLDEEFNLRMHLTPQARSSLEQVTPT